MLKRNAALLIVGGLLVGGVAVAWAKGPASRPSFAADLAVAQAATTDPSTAPADRQALRDQIKQCLQERRAARQSGSTAAPSAACQALRDKAKGLGLGRGLKARGLSLMARADHGTLDVKNANGQYETLTFDKGEVAAGTSSDQIAVTRPDGKTVTLKIDAGTKFRGIASAADLQPGAKTLVVSKDGTATMIAQRKPGAAGGAASPSSADLGDLAA